MVWISIFAGAKCAVTFWGSIKTAASEYLKKGTDSDRQATSLIVNGGHYMTTGHFITCLLYIKDVLDVKNYFGWSFLSFKVSPLRRRS